MDQDAVRQAFSAALDALVQDIREDRAILAAILCGSLAHDVVWKRSDIDLVLVTIDDKNVPSSDLALNADGINVHALLLPRAEFRKTIEGSTQNSFIHSFLAKGQLLYTHDPTIADMCGRLQSLGARDAAVQLLRSATGALSAIDKAHKWLVTRADLDYTAFWLLHAAVPLARIEVIGAGLLADREVVLQALRLNPSFFELVYTRLLNERKTRARVEAALEAVDEYVAARAPTLFAPVVEYLQETGEPRSSNELEHYFKKNYDVEGVTIVCEYLAEREVIGKASVAARLTKRSNVDVPELAFFHRGGSADAH